MNHPLGSPEWLRALADQREALVTAFGAIGPEEERKEREEIEGLRLAARTLDLFRDCL